MGLHQVLETASCDKEGIGHTRGARNDKDAVIMLDTRGVEFLSFVGVGVGISFGQLAEGGSWVVPLRSYPEEGCTSPAKRPLL